MAGAVGSAVESCAQQGFVQLLVGQSEHDVVHGDNLNALALQVVAELSDAEKYAGRRSYAHKLEVCQQLEDCKKAAAAAAVHAAGWRRVAAGCHTLEAKLAAAV